MSLPPTPTERSALLRDAALRDVLGIGLLAAAGGVGARALLGSSYLFGPATPAGVGDRDVLPDQVKVPLPYYARAREKDQAERQARKAPPVKAANTQPGFWGSLFRGENVDTKHGLPGYWPMAMLAGVGGLAGGYGLADHFLDKKRKADLKAQVDAAKQRYEQALIDSYDPARLPVGKAAAARDPLDELADRLGVTDQTPHKQASTWGELTGRALNAYGAFAVPASLLAAVAAYRYTKSRGTDALLQDALKKRERERLARRPPEVFAVPEPVAVDRHQHLVSLDS